MGTSDIETTSVSSGRTTENSHRGSVSLNSSHFCWRCKMTLVEIEEARNAPNSAPSFQVTGSGEQKPKPVRAMIHPCVDPPLCADCTRLELSFFDPLCPGCRKLLEDPATSVPDIFAIMRQWTPQTQQAMEMLVDEILKRGAGVNDRDGLTDMTLLHYATKSGAAGIGDADCAMRVASMLIDAGADVHIRCRWTNMTALHYAAYFDVVTVLKVLLKATGALDVDSTCSEFEHGTALHIAASNLAHEACKVLLQNGANPSLRDDLNRMPVDCVPDPNTLNENTAIAGLVIKLKKTLSEALPPSPRKPPPNYDLVHSKVTLQALGLALGDKIMVGGVKSGTLRYCGPTEFASGVWAGVELDEPAGKNNGSVGGFSYFTCSDGHGIFAPISKITKLGAVQRTRTPPATHRFPIKELPSIDVSRVTAKIDTGLNKQSSMDSEIVELEDRVVVAGQRKGTVKFIGETQFAAGQWYGVELDKPVGKNDGAVNGVHYFSCKPKHGVFAPLTRLQKLGDKKFSSNESLDTISWGAVSEKVDRRKSALNRPRSSVTPTRPPIQSLSRTPGQGTSRVLEPGTTVLCNNELGTIRYIGTAEFAEGIWLGVELRKPKGKNDGSVGGRRYFSCPPGCGLMVKPSRVTVRGINGARILAEQTADLAVAHNIARATSGSGSGNNLNRESIGHEAGANDISNGSRNGHGHHFIKSSWNRSSDREGSVANGDN
ncbi:Cap-gly domain-containing linker protein 3 [Plakobranchus ocellatus]|uniref:Cap-gly domain-containing linker protein 3 n=1 Tax=Plakobranchus ocellatus TaxID=259542 RepID=A0AAV4A8H6_9GAST|nr:Cap-gly domain-containing linker protein 3 [Plakobranchus ocellatus]